jgi:hypothetical protein
MAWFPVTLVGKNNGADEVGLGLMNDPSGENEITAGNFVQLDLRQVQFASLNMSFQAGSTTSSNPFGGAEEAWTVFGNNSPGFLGSVLLGTCEAPPGSGPGNACEQIFNFPTAASFNFLDVTGGPGNILLRAVDAVTVPAPIVGAGLPGLIGERWPSRPVATAAEKRLSFRRRNQALLAARKRSRFGAPFASPLSVPGGPQEGSFAGSADPRDRSRIGRRWTAIWRNGPQDCPICGPSCPANAETPQACHPHVDCA